MQNATYARPKPMQYAQASVETANAETASRGGQQQNAAYARPGFGQYRQSSIETADRGQLIIMIYDHCIKWCITAKEMLEEGRMAQKSEACQKVQAGITELMSSLDMQKGGDIAKNLWRLYDFYSFHIHEGNMKNISKNFEDVQNMMSQLRESWQKALVEVRKDTAMSKDLSTGTPRSYVSMVG
ncbi:MAG: flagellar export chaperone FliS [Fibromonadaceae bacterium]|jgi:flagellar protein FliS|nr:flagellar export chaperone FliS [Fibromonadaceae bacterium]